MALAARRWVLPVLLLIALLAGVQTAAGGAARPPAVPVAATASHTGVLSARRVPALLTRTIADTRLSAQLDAVLADPGLGQGRQQSCLVVTSQGRPVYARNPAMALIPASNLKVLTALAVLAKINPDERLVTEARLAGGTLWLVGGGDPLLSTADYLDWQKRVMPERAARLVATPMEVLADRVAAAGITSIPGGVRGDEHRFDEQRYIPTWKRGYITAGEVGPESALVVNDGFVAFTPQKVPAPAPAKHAADVLATLLQARGVTVAGGTGEGRVPAGATVVARVESPPLREVVGEMLRESDNMTAELLLKELGHRFAGEGSTAAGGRVLRDVLAAAGLPVDQLAAVDGSGLDRSDRASCGLLLQAVERAGPNGDVAAGLPVAARDGTLATRFQGHPAAGRLRAKTGSLDGVTGLTGFLDGPAGSPPLAFALLGNGLPSEAVGRGLQESVARALAAYPDGPNPAQLGP